MDEGSGRGEGENEAAKKRILVAQKRRAAMELQDGNSRTQSLAGELRGCA